MLECCGKGGKGRWWLKHPPDLWDDVGFRCPRCLLALTYECVLPVKRNSSHRVQPSCVRSRCLKRPRIPDLFPNKTTGRAEFDRKGARRDHFRLLVGLPNTTWTRHRIEHRAFSRRVLKKDRSEVLFGVR